MGWWVPRGVGRLHIGTKGLTSLRESDSDSEHEADPGDKVNAESSDATRPKKKQRQVSITAP